MTLTEGRAQDLADRSDRDIARLAYRATCNTVFGGASALVLAKRMDALGCQIDALSIVSAVYSASTGSVLSQYRVCICPECGQTLLGEGAALNCCPMY